MDKFFSRIIRQMDFVWRIFATQAKLGNTSPKYARAEPYK